MDTCFDFQAFFDELQATKPPYKCPFKNCDKVYRSFGGIQYHVLHSHNTNGWKLPNKLNKWNKNRLNEDLLENNEDNEDAKNNENGEEFDGTFRLFFDGQKVLVKEEAELEFTSNENEESDKLVVQSKEPSNSIQLKDTVVHPLPKPQYSEYELENNDGYSYHIPQKYINNNDGNSEAVNDSLTNGDCVDEDKSESNHKDKEQLEYCLDEEDLHWMSEINKKRAENLHLSEPIFEKMIDILEKKSQFISQHNRGNSLVDDSALCSVCFDGTSHPSNNIIFCDMCNLAVHQDCYGVPYVPEGYWHCRPCLLSPSKQVQCCLCPKQGGALKQSTDGRWVHVLCAAWVPEVHFANPVFLEPIEGLESIPQARWKLACILCRQRRVGACIQCHRPNCYASFHVLCAILANFHLAMMPRSETTTAIRSSLFLSSHLFGNIKKLAYCDVHTHEKKYRDNDKSHKSPKKRFTYKFDEDDDDEEESVLSKAKIEKIVANRVKKGRIVSAELRRGQGSISYPYISNMQAQELYSNVEKMLGLQPQQETNMEDDLKVEGDIKEEVVMADEKQETIVDNTDVEQNNIPTDPQPDVDLDCTIELKEPIKTTNSSVKPISSENLCNLIQRYWFLKRLSRQGCSLIRNLPYHMAETSEEQADVDNPTKELKQETCETEVVGGVKDDDDDVEKISVKKRAYKKVKRDLLAENCMEDKSEDENDEYKSEKKSHSFEKKSKKIKTIKTIIDSEVIGKEADEVKSQNSSNRKKYSSFSSLLKEQQEDETDKGDLLNVSGRPQRKRKLSSVLLDYSYYTTPVKKVKRGSTGKNDSVKAGSESKSDANNSGAMDGSLNRTTSSLEEATPNKSVLNESHVSTNASMSEQIIKKSSKTPRKSTKKISLDFSDFDEVIKGKGDDYGDSNMSMMRRMKKEMMMVKRLVFMVEKREQIKLQQVQNDSRLMNMLLQPLQGIFTHLIKQLKQLDHYRFFHTAVNVKQVPDYLDIIKHPMDFSLMNAKVSRKEYTEVSDLEADFNTIINNCTLYNCPDTVYYKAAIELKNQSADVIKEAKMMEKQITSYLKNQVKVKLVENNSAANNLLTTNGHAGDDGKDGDDEDNDDKDGDDDDKDGDDDDKDGDDSMMNRDLSSNDMDEAVNRTGRKSKSLLKTRQSSKITNFFHKEVLGEGGMVGHNGGSEEYKLKERLTEDFDDDSVGDSSNDEIENKKGNLNGEEENIDSTLSGKNFFRNSSQEAVKNDHSFSKIQKDNFYDNVNANKTVFLDFRAALSHKSPAKHLKT